MPNNNQKTKSRDTFSYIANGNISEYMKEKKEFNAFTLKAKDRSRFLKDEKRKDADLRQKKRRMLKRIIFPSMANLVVFFESLKNDPKLIEEFEDDIKELFGYIKEPRDRNKKNQEEYNKRTCIIRRFMESLLTWDSKNDPNNFRLELILELQKIIVEIIGKHFLNIKYGTIHGVIAPNVFLPDGIVIADLARAEAWTKIYASKYSDSEQAKKDREKIPSRPVAF